MSIRCVLVCQMGFPDSSVGKEFTCNAGDPGSIQDPSSNIQDLRGVILKVILLLSLPIPLNLALSLPCPGGKLWLSLMALQVSWGKGEPYGHFKVQNTSLGSEIGMCSLSFPGGSVVKNLPASAGATGDLALIPGLRRSPGVGNGNPLQYSGESHGQRSLAG